MTNLNRDQAKHIKLIEKILQDPLLLRQFSEQVYQLLLDDLHCQRDRFPML